MSITVCADTKIQIAIDATVHSFFSSASREASSQPDCPEFELMFTPIR